MNREAAYADAVAALLDATPDGAQRSFDEALTEAVAAGLDPTLARTLRWRQRESARAVRDHAAAVLPALICGLLDSPVSEARPEPRLAALPVADDTDPADHRDPADDRDEADDRRRVLVAGLLALPDPASA